VNVLHLDDHLVIVDKPSGVVVHRGWADDDGGVLVALRRQLGRRVWPVHRLDRGASGALAFALDAGSAAALGRAFAEGQVDKRYLALVRGHPPEQLRIDHPLPPGEDAGDARVDAVTEVRRLGIAAGEWSRYALVQAIPHTGRLHQIRRHLKHIACPIIGDVNYGKGEHNRLFRERFGLHRLALHAFALAVPHPTTGAEIAVRCPPSGSLADCLQALGCADLISAIVAA
jgi:tRNA pseudouridine65 synthase